MTPEDMLNEGIKMVRLGEAMMEAANILIEVGITEVNHDGMVWKDDEDD